MPNAWVEHVRQYAKENNLSYGRALSMPDCKNTYVCMYVCIYNI